MLPKDPVMLLSYLNMQLRDHYPNLDELCGALDLEREVIVRKMKEIQCVYDQEQNQFR